MSSSTRNTSPSVDSESKVDGMGHPGDSSVEDHTTLTSETDDDETVEAMKNAHLKGKEPPLGPEQDKEAKRSRADSDDDDDDDKNKEIAAKKPKTTLDEVSNNNNHSTTTPAASQSHQRSYNLGDDDEQQQQQQQRQQPAPAKGKVPITCAHLQGHLAPAYVEQANAIAELMKQYE
ncbi:hypothetical protein LTR66_011099 [Elasticomyces elasticus]|nr:hypothetical protein LTR28_010128 [Elasticomyces elasticus]KAK4974072.1 hypothetical protein LTR66_011099 [Elasticomyces elasticus]